MSLISWMNASMTMDIACVVFLAALVWKNRKTQKDILNERRILKMELGNLRKDLDLVMKNPNAARRLLKERKQSV